MKIQPMVGGGPPPHILYRYNNGTPTYTWSTIEDISANIGSFEDGYPCIAVDTMDMPHVVWMNYVTYGIPFPTPVGYQSIFYSRRTGIISTWLSNVAENTVALSLSTADNLYPSIAIQPSQNLDAVWERCTAVTGDHEIYYRQDTYDTTLNQWSGWNTMMDVSNDSDQKDLYPNLAYKKHGLWNSKQWQGIPGLSTDDGYDFVWTKGNIAPYGIWFRGTAKYDTAVPVELSEYLTE